MQSLPAPPSTSQLTGKWLRSPEGKATLKAYMDFVYALQGATTITDGKSVTGHIESTGTSALINVNSGIDFPQAIADPGTSGASLQTAVISLLNALRQMGRLPRG